MKVKLYTFEIGKKHQSEASVGLFTKFIVNFGTFNIKIPRESIWTAITALWCYIHTSRND
jgi:hypothetical protein